MPESNKKNILFLTCRFPYPLHTGDRIKSFYLIKHLAKSHNVTLVTFFQGKQFKDEYNQIFADMGVNLKIVKLDPIKAGVKSIFTNYIFNPLEINYYKQREYQKVVDELIKNNKFDLGISFFMRTAEYLKNYKNLKKILIAEDCRILYQKRSFQESKSLIQKIVRIYEYQTLKSYEPKMMKNFDSVTLVTQNDIDELLKYSPETTYKLLTNGTRTEYFVPNPDVEKTHIVFTGGLGLWANYIMIEKIINEIMPEIWKEFPKVKFVIAGANPTKDVLKFASDKVEIHTNVPSILPYLQSALAFIHPHKAGTGIQNKLLEAMSCGVPVITTTIGNQGINGVHRESIMLAESNEDFIDMTLEILKNKELAEKISKNARELIVNTHSWELIYDELDKIVNDFS